MFFMELRDAAPSIILFHASMNINDVLNIVHFPFFLALPLLQFEAFCNGEVPLLFYDLFFALRLFLPPKIPADKYTRRNNRSHVCPEGKSKPSLLSCAVQ